MLGLCTAKLCLGLFTPPACVQWAAGGVSSLMSAGTGPVDSAVNCYCLCCMPCCTTLVCPHTYLGCHHCNHYGGACITRKPCLFLTLQVGVTADTIKIGDNADWASGFVPLSQGQREHVRVVLCCAALHCAVGALSQRGQVWRHRAAHTTAPTPPVAHRDDHQTMLASRPPATEPDCTPAAPHPMHTLHHAISTLPMSRMLCALLG